VTCYKKLRMASRSCEVFVADVDDEKL